MLRTNAEPNKDGLAIYYSINEGSSWDLVPKVGSYDWNWYNKLSIEALNHAGWDSVTNKWIKARQILPANVANAPLVKFRFVFMSNDTITTEGFAIDDIRIYNAPTDAGIAAIVTPKNECNLSKTQEITVAVKNYGIRPITPNDTLFSKVVINSTKTIIDTFITVSPIAIGGTANFTFSGTANMFAKKWYKMTASTQVKGDTSYYVAGISNNSKTDSAYVKGEPLYSLGPDIGTTVADTVILDGKVHSVGGADFIHYYWIYEGRPDSTITIADDRYFGVPPYPALIDTMVFSITVVNDSGCPAYDTIQIINSSTDIGISNIAGISDKCIGNQDQMLEVEITNFTSGYTMLTGTQIKVGYKLGEEENEDPHIESFYLTTDLLPGNSVNYSFLAQQPQYSAAGIQNLTVFTVVNADLDYSNDTMIEALEIFAIPEVDFGADSILTMQADSIVLDAGVGTYPYSYLWQDASTDTTFAISTNLTGLYSVTVTDVTNGCGSAKDSVLIISDNWVLDSLINPTSLCSPTSAEQISINLINNSPNTFVTGYTIPTVINFNGVSFNEPIVLTSTVNPFESIAYTFPQTFDMLEVKEYTVNVNINPMHDYNRLDNELAETVNIWGIKKVELGPDSIITQRADTIILNAGNQFETYTWQNGSTESTFQILTQNSETYWIDVTDFNNCPPSSDTVRIKAMDLAMEEIISPESKCTIEGMNAITFTVKNTGPDVIEQGEIINIKYFANSEIPKSQLYHMPYNLYPDQTNQITLYEEFNFNAEESYQFTLYVNWDKDYYNENDTLKTIVYQLDHPTVDLGNDIYTTQADTVILRAQPNYTNYKWQNSSRGDTLAVSQNYTAEYWVEVGNAYGCTDADTLTIFTYDIGIASVEGLDACEPSANNYPTLNVNLNSQDVLVAGQQITAKYTFNATEVTEMFVLTEDFTSAATLPLTFTIPFTVIDTGNFSIECSVEMANEVVTDNNVMVGNFRIGATHYSLGDDIRTTNDTVILDAGSNFISYLWSNGATTQTTIVRNNGDYSVTVTDSDGCNSSDVVNVYFIPASLFISDFVNPLFGCEKIIDELSTIVIKNGGSKIVPSGTSLTIGYQIDNETRINEVSELETNFPIGASYTYEFNTPFTIENSGTHNISFFINLDSKDIDTAKYTIPVYEKPIFFEGKDTIGVSGLPIELNPNVTANSYLWNTTETTPTIMANDYGEYWVKIIADNTCEFTGTVYVKNTTAIHDAWSNQISVYPNPGETEIWVQLPKNIGKVTLQITDLNGKMILIQDDVFDNLKLDISKWNQGVYILRIFNSSQFGIYQIVKQ